MQAKTEIFAQLIRQCRMLRMAQDVDRARAALDVEQDLVDLMRTKGLQLPDGAVAIVRRRRNRRSSAEVAAVTAGGAV